VTGDRVIKVTPPMRIVFNAYKHGVSGQNDLTVKLYNLTQDHRLALAKDIEQSDIVIPVELLAGYRDALLPIFTGTVLRGSNEREGPDLVTILDCKDGGTDFQTGFVNATVKGKAQAIKAVLDAMPRTGRGKITDLAECTRPIVLVGPPARILDKLIDTGEAWFVDGEKLYIIKDDETVDSYVPVVNAGTGLINTPTRDSHRVTFESLINPALRIGGLCQLESVTAPQMNGVYKLDAIEYNGDNYGKTWQQTVTGILSTEYVATI
jgi:hypothetical protein